jgi:hypothetical protein
MHGGLRCANPPYVFPLSRQFVWSAILSAMRDKRMTAAHSKKAARHKAGGFFDNAPQAARQSV